jgi:hypothetical protein
MWFTGQIGEAVAQIQSTGKVLVVFGKGTDQVSVHVDKMFADLSPELSSILNSQAICLKLDEDSDGFNQFKEFFFVSATPFVYFVNQNGKMCEPITGNTISETAIKAALTAPTPVEPSTTPAQAPTSPAQEATTDLGVSAADEMTRQEEIQRKVAETREKIEQVRREKAKKAADEQREKEKQRREMGQKAAEIQQEREQANLKRIAEKRRKEKIADAEARARVKKQIEDDRRARNVKYDEKHEEEMKAKQAELDEIKAKKLREEREKLEEQRRLRDTCARIQFRFHDGSTRTESFGADDPLSKARDFVVENQICDRFVLGTSFPKRRFTSEEESKSFRQLGLTPSTALTVIPIQSAISNSSNGIISTIMAIIMIPINIVLSILSGITGRQTNETQQPTASSAGPPSSNNPNLRRRTNRLSDLDDDERKRQYNGNSTEQDS